MVKTYIVLKHNSLYYLLGSYTDIDNDLLELVQSWKKKVKQDTGIHHKYLSVTFYNENMYAMLKTTLCGKLKDYKELLK